MIIIDRRWSVAPLTQVIVAVRRSLSGRLAVILVLSWMLAVPAPGAARAIAQAQREPQPTEIVVRESVRTSEDKGWLDHAAAGGQVLAALAALLVLPFIAAQLLFGRHDARMQHTADLLSRWEARDFRMLRSRVKAFLEVADEAECIDKLFAWERVAHSEAAELPRGRGLAEGPLASQNDVDQVRNFFEDVAIRYNEGEIVREPVVASIGFAAVTEVLASLWLTHFERDGRSGKDYPLYREWEVMVEDLRRGPKLNPPLPWRKPASTTADAIEHLKTVEPEQHIGVICLPREEAEQEWALAKRLSLAVKDRSRLERLVARIPDRNDAPRTRWRAFVVPSKLGMSDEELAREEQLSWKLAIWLDGVDLAELERTVVGFEREGERGAADQA